MSTKLNFVSVYLAKINLNYYSTLVPFSHIRSRERAKYATVLHSKIVYYTTKSRFRKLSGWGTEKPNFDMIFPSGIINLWWPRTAIAKNPLS